MGLRCFRPKAWILRRKWRRPSGSTCRRRWSATRGADAGGGFAEDKLPVVPPLREEAQFVVVRSDRRDLSGAWFRCDSPVNVRAACCDSARQMPLLARGVGLRGESGKWPNRGLMPVLVVRRGDKNGHFGGPQAGPAGGWQPASRMWRPKIRVLLLLGWFQPLVPTVWRMVSALP